MLRVPKLPSPRTFVRRIVLYRPMAAVLQVSMDLLNVRESYRQQGGQV